MSQNCLYKHNFVFLETKQRQGIKIISFRRSAAGFTLVFYSVHSALMLEEKAAHKVTNEQQGLIEISLRNRKKLCSTQAKEVQGVFVNIMRDRYERQVPPNAGFLMNNSNETR